MKYLFCFFLMILNTGALKAQTLSLNGEWMFAVDSSGTAKPETLTNLYWRKINTPSSWQQSFDDLRDYQGIGWYRKSIDINLSDPQKIYLLRFDAVDYLTGVYFNGKLLGSHEGGYTPFSFEITNLIKKGDNEILLRVLDPQYDPPGTEGIQFQNIPHGKQDWYVQTSGIWQDAAIDIKPQLYFTSVHITPDNSGKIEVMLKLNKQAEPDKVMMVSVISPDGKEILNKKITLPSSGSFSFSADVPNPLLWSFDHPYLYKLKLRLDEEESLESFGFRNIETRDKKLYLNGEPFYLMAALDQDFYPSTIYSTPSEDYVRDEMIKAKQLGLNTLRCHIKAPDPVYLKVADEVGLLIWYEIPNWSIYTAEAARRGSETIDAMVERDWNHPSLVIISLINESWGLDLSQKEQRRWLTNEYDRVKQVARGRLVVDNSACEGNFHMKTDVNDYHTYWAIPENRTNFDRTISDVASRPAWLFSKYGDSFETGNEPLIISEFGNWGLPELSGEDPWWFSRNFLDNQLVLPKGYNERFLKYKYDELFSDYNELAVNSQRAQFQSLKYEIESIRLRPEIQGYVITEFTDINWECNGLLDMWRNFKENSKYISLIQQQDVIIPRPVKYNYQYGEHAEIKIFISHYGSKSLEGAELSWETAAEKSGKVKIKDIGRTDVQELETVKFKIDKTPGSIRVIFRLQKGEEILAENFTEIYVYPATNKSDIPVGVVDSFKDMKDFRKVLSENYPVNDKSNIIITNILDKSILDKAEKGFKVICLTDTNTAIPEDFPVKLISRNEEWYDGNWASNLNWKKPQHPYFSNINHDKYFGFEIAQSVPRQVISNIKPEDFVNAAAGMYAGWIQLNSAYIYDMKYGKGKIILCTFPLAKNYERDPFARTLLDNMIRTE